ISLPFADARAEGEAAMAATAHEFFQAVAHAEADGAEVAAGLADAKGQMPLAAAEPARLADDLQATGQEHRLRIAPPLRLQARPCSARARRHGGERNLGAEGQGER